MSRHLIVFFLVLGLGGACSPVSASVPPSEADEKRAEDEDHDSDSTEYESGRFILDTGFTFSGVLPGYPLYTPWFMLRGRFQVTRHFAVEVKSQTFPYLFPLLVTHTAGVRVQWPLPKYWSIFAAGRGGVLHTPFILRDSGTALSYLEAGLGAERLVPSGVLFGVEMGAGIIGPYARFNFGYAF